MLGILDKILGDSQKPDDPNVLPPQFIPVYKMPYKFLGLTTSAPVAEIRNCFRKLSTCYIKEFSGNVDSGISFDQIIFAYHISRGTISGNAEEINKMLPTCPYFDDPRPSDILPLLRPVRNKYCDFPCIPGYRGFRQLHVIYKTCSMVFVNDVGSLFYTHMYKFDVHYCMRLHEIEVTYDQVLKLNESLSKELLILPDFPEEYSTDRDKTGTGLAHYLMRTHRIQANKGEFSPRLLAFLQVDFEKVQSEEEGQLVTLIDSSNLPTGTVWHIVDMEWLSKWKRFVVGREARRFVPPGPITNMNLLHFHGGTIPAAASGGQQQQQQEVLQSNVGATNANTSASAVASAASSSQAQQPAKGTLGKKRWIPRENLEISVHYRAVNYNVWALLYSIHGGGPSISRKQDSLYSSVGYSYLQAIVMIQTRMRMFLSKRRRRELYVKLFSLCGPAQELILQCISERREKMLAEKVAESRQTRQKGKYHAAISFTQTQWRRKKNYETSENLQRAKQNQEMLARIKGKSALDESSDQNGLVVDAMFPIINIGTSSQYTVLMKDRRLPFQLVRLPGTKNIIIGSSTQPNIENDSKILAINNIPCAQLSLSELKQRLASVQTPVQLLLERPLNKYTCHVALASIMKIGEKDPVLGFNMFKYALAHGITVLKFTSMNSILRGSYVTVLQTTESELLYLSRNDNSVVGGMLNRWKTRSLYSMLFVQDKAMPLMAPLRYGGSSGHPLTIQMHNKCVEVCTDDKHLYFCAIKSSLELAVRDDCISSIAGIKPHLSVFQAIAILRKKARGKGESVDMGGGETGQDMLDAYLQKLPGAMISPKKLYPHISDTNFKTLLEYDMLVSHAQGHGADEEDGVRYTGSRHKVGSRVYARSKNNKFYSLGVVIYSSPTVGECDVLFDETINPIDGHMLTPDEQEESEEDVDHGHSFMTAPSMLTRNAATTDDELTEIHKLLLWGFKELCSEVKKSQWFVDETGVPTKRTSAKIGLSKLSTKDA